VAGLKVRLVVRRWKEGWRAPRYDAFEVEADPSESVLDLVERVSLKLDPTLTFEHACHHGVCGACGMVVNGVERLTCVTRVGDVARNGVILVEPLHGFKVVSDLVVDKSRMFSRYPDDTRTLERVAAQVEKLWDCVECGICYSACPVACTYPSYLGPSVLAWAFHRAVEEGKVTAPVASRSGVWSCHAAFDCSEKCPVNFQPGEKIMRLRRLLLRGAVEVV
jgi:succinate dehydrogenase / fumarate reductase iron-sulfur subunit